MAVKRSQRQFGIQPIGVNRVAPYNQDIANQVVGIADDIYARQYEIAKGEAEKRGAETAAEASLQSVTTLNATTLEPQAMELTKSMGRFSAESFERVLLRRFENSVSDDIEAKKMELMAKIGDSPDGPKLFEKTFTEYLNGLGANASGFYKQVIVDNGAQQLTDGRTRLHVAQIARMRAAAKAAQADRDNKLVEQAYNQGFEGSGDIHSFYEKRAARAVEDKDLVGSGISEQGELTKLQKRQQAAWIRGVAARGMQDPKVAKSSGLISAYFKTGGNKELFSLMPPAAQDFVLDMKASYGIDEPIEYAQVEEILNGEIASASKAGAIFAEVEKAQAEASEAKLKAEVDATKESATSVEEQLILQNEDQYGEAIGAYASITQISQTLDALNSVDYDPNVVGRDLNKSVITQVSKQKSDIAKGLLKRTLSGLSKEQQKLLADAIDGGIESVIVDMMPKLQANIFLREYKRNPAEMSKVARSWANGNQQIYDEQKAAQELALDRQVRYLSDLLQSPDVSREEKEAAFSAYQQNWSSNPYVQKSYISASKDLDGYMRKDSESRAKSRWDRGSVRIENYEVDSGNLQGHLTTLESLAKDTNADQGEAIKSAQRIANQGGIAEVTRIASTFGESLEAAAQLFEMARYAKTGLEGSSLSPEGKQIIDFATSMEADFLGVKLSPERQAISDALGAQANQMQESINKTKQLQSDRQFRSTAISGGVILNANEEGVRAKLSGVFRAQADGDVDTGLYERNPSSWSQPEVKFATLDKSQKSAVTVEYANSAERALMGTLSSEGYANFMINTREMMFSQDPSGRAVVNAGVVAALGSEKAAKLEALFIAYQAAPIGNEGAYMIEAASQIAKPMSNSLFNELTGYKTPEAMVIAAGVPSTLSEQMVPLARAFASTHGSEAFSMLEQSIEKRFTSNPNAYSPITGGSFVPYDISMFTDDVAGFEKGVARIVDRINGRDDSSLFFTPNTGVFGVSSIEELRGEASNIAVVYAGEGRERESLMTGDRVLYGPTLDSSPTNPMFQLFKMNEFGQVEPIPNSKFNLNNLEIQIGMNGILPPKPRTAEPSLEIQGAVDVQPTPKRQPSPVEKTRESKIGADLSPRYSGATSGSVIEPDEQLIKDVRRVIGSGSVAAQVMSEYGSYSMAQKQTNITRAIKSAEDMPAGKSRDKILDRLYEIRNSLRGR